MASLRLMTGLESGTWICPIDSEEQRTLKNSIFSFFFFFPPPGHWFNLHWHVVAFSRISTDHLRLHCSNVSLSSCSYDDIGFDHASTRIPDLSSVYPYRFSNIYYYLLLSTQPKVKLQNIKADHKLLNLQYSKNFNRGVHNKLYRRHLINHMHFFFLLHIV